MKYNGASLTLNSFSNTDIVVTLPVAAATAGTFRLTLTNSQGNASTFDLTYGATGPQGAKGNPGPAGGVLSFAENYQPNSLTLPGNAGWATINAVILSKVGTYVIG